MSERGAERYYAFRRDEEKKDVQFASRFELPELEMTAEERQAAESAIDAFSELARGLGLSDAKFSLDRIHFIDPSVREKTVGGLGRIEASADGFWQDGHVYVIRGSSPLVTVHTLTHELAHGVSYYASSAKRAPGQGETAAYDVEMRSGLYSWLPDARADRSGSFRGLNEAMTELTANLVRWRVGRAAGLDDRRMQLLETELNYKPQVAVLEALLARLSKKTADGAAGFERLLRDYLTGERRFLEEAERLIPGATAHLAAMDTTFESALETAAALGLDEAVKELRILSEKSRRDD